MRRGDRPIGIGMLAAATGTTVETIRFYERIGLLPAPERTAGNQRLYGAAARRRLDFVRRARDLGFSLQAIRELLRLADRPDQPCTTIDRLARGRLADVRRRLVELKALEADLEQMIEACSGGSVADCSVIESLADRRHRRGAESRAVDPESDPPPGRD